MARATAAAALALACLLLASHAASAAAEPAAGARKLRTFIPVVSKKEPVKVEVKPKKPDLLAKVLPLLLAKKGKKAPAPPVPVTVPVAPRLVPAPPVPVAISGAVSGASG